jgi:hypothetical protein
VATRIDPFSSNTLKPPVASGLADTERGGVSGTQIERLLKEIQVADTSPGITKWKLSLLLPWIQRLQWQSPPEPHDRRIA